MEAAARFWAKVDRRGPDECWPWLAFRSEGYGRLKTRAGVELAHRFAYELLVGPIPDGLTLDHLCRNRACVNPAHLEPVTNRENILRGEGVSAQAARQAVCANGHPFTGRDSRGWRYCDTCSEERRLRRKERAFDQWAERFVA